MGSSTDLVAEGTRRVLINGAYWLLDLEIPNAGTKVNLVGKLKPGTIQFQIE